VSHIGKTKKSKPEIRFKNEDFIFGMIMELYIVLKQTQTKQKQNEKINLFPYVGLRDHRLSRRYISL
jgi:hypothetical protein